MKHTDISPPLRVFTALAAALALSGCQPEAPPAPEIEAATPAPAKTVAEGDYAFVNVNVVSMHTDQPLPGQTVVIRDGAISLVAPGDALALSDATRVIDGRGRYLMPALTDMHNHIFGPETMKLDVAWGVTTIRNMFGNPQALEWRDAIERGEMFGPEIVCGTPLIDDDPPYFKGSATLTSPEDADAFVAGMKARGYDFLKPYELLKADVYEAMMAAADKYGMTVEGHIPQSVPVARAIELGHDTIEHGMRLDAAIIAEGIPWDSGYRSRELVDLVARIDAGELTYEEAFDRDKLREIARFAAEKGTALVPTLGVVMSRAYARADKLKMAEHPQLKYVPPAIRDFWLSTEPPNEELVNEGVMVDLSDEEIDSLKYYSSVEYGQWVKIMHEEGVLLLGGIDAPNPGMFHGYSMHDELALFVDRAGLTPFEALKTATVNPAVYWGEEGKRGVVAEGAQADLLLVSGNPLEDITRTRAIEGVMMNGEWLDRADLDDLLDSVEAAFIAQAEAMAAASEEQTGDDTNP